MDKYLKAPKFARNYFSFSTQNEYCLHTFSGVPLTSTPYINNIEDSEQIIFNNSEAGSFLSQRIYGKRWACSKIKISIFLTKKRIFFLFCFFFLLTLLAALCCIYSSILCKENKFIAENIKIREIFYKLDVCNFQDSNKDGRGDFLGIVQNLNYLKALGVSHIILTNLCFSVSNAHAQLFHDLNKLIDTSHVLGIKIIWDITRHIDEDGIKIFPKRIDGYFFSPAQYTVNSKKKLNPEILNNIEKSVVGNKSTWYIEVAIFEDNINYKIHLLTTLYLYPSLSAIILSYQLRKNYVKNTSTYQKGNLYNFFTDKILKVQGVKNFKFIHHIDSQEKDERDIYMYSYLYAAISFTNAPIMLKTGQEFESCGHLTMNYSERMIKIRKNNEKSYIDYYIDINRALRDRRNQLSLQSTVYAETNQFCTWARRKVIGKNKAVYAVSFLRPPTDANKNEAFKNAKFFFYHSNPLRIKHGGNITLLAVYYAYAECELDYC